MAETSSMLLHTLAMTFVLGQLDPLLNGELYLGELELKIRKLLT